MILIFINIILDEMEKMNVGTLINDVRSFILDKGKKIIKFIKKNSIFLSGMIVCLLIILFYAMSAGHYVDFFPTNGTFQNYNPVRRFLNGQVPYKDFQDYLGLGHLYIGSLITLLFGGTFRASLIAFSFLTMLGFALIIFVVAKVIFKK